MQKATTPSKSGRDKAGSRGFFSEAASGHSTSRSPSPRAFILTCAILWSCFLQLSSSNSSASKKPILIDSIVTQPDKLQLCFHPMGHYTASPFTSHVQIPFDYSALLHLQDKMIERVDRCIPDLDRFNFNLDQYNRATLNSTFELYKSDIRQVFKLFKDLLASLPHVPEWQRRQWDITSFVTATASLKLSTYNTVQISKLESAIEAQKQQTDLLADIVRLHEQHLHKLDEMIEDIGNEIQKLKVQAGFHFSIDRAIAQVTSDTNKLRAVIAFFERVINSAFDQKLAPVWTFWKPSCITSWTQGPKINSTISSTNLQTSTNLKPPSFTARRNIW
jgi:hypothetical protein